VRRHLAILFDPAFHDTNDIRVLCINCCIFYSIAQSSLHQVGCPLGLLMSLIAFFAVVAIAGALGSVNAIRWSVGLKTLGREDHPWDRMVGEAHPLDYVEGKH
jgi:hypothetical protein